MDEYGWSHIGVSGILQKTEKSIDQHIKYETKTAINWSHPGFPMVLNYIKLPIFVTRIATKDWY